MESTQESGSRVLTADALTFTAKTDSSGITYWVSADTAAATFANTYTEEPRISVTATKTWQDASNSYATRPLRVTFDLYRKTTLLAEEYVTSQTINITSANSQSAVFTSQLKYATTGETYTYYVKEAAVAGYEKTEDELEVTNTLPVRNLTVKKTWKKQNGTTVSDLTATQLQQLKDLGALPAKVDFTLQYRDSDSESWQNLKKTVNGVMTDVTASLDVAALSDITKLQNATVGFNGVPKYVEGSTQVLRQYRVVETFPSGYSNYTSNASSVVADSNGQIAVTNTLPVREAQIDKAWIDNTNRDNTRPSSISISLTRDGSSTLNISLSRSNAVSVGDSLYDYNTWTTGTFYIPLYKNNSTQYSQYTSQETQPENYNQVTTQGFPQQTDSERYDGAGNNYWKYTNQLVQLDERQVITVSAEKKWSQDTAVSTLTRPATVYYTLYVKVGDTFVPATTANCGLSGTATLSAAAGSASTYSVSWKDVWKYRTEDGTAIAKAMQYQVFETTAAGVKITADSTFPYTPTYEPAQITGTDALTKVVVTNTLKTTTVLADKVWSSDTAGTQVFSTTELQNLLDAGVLPKAVRFGIYYATSADAQQWSAYTNNDGAVTIDKATATLENLNALRGTNFTVSGLPLYNSANQTLYYKLVEIAVTYNGTDWTSVAPTGGIAGGFAASHTWSTTTQYSRGSTHNINQLEVGSVSVSKTWTDEENRDGTRTSIEVQLVRDGLDYGDPVTIQKSSDGWNYTWNNLPLYKNSTVSGEENLSVYTVRETEVDKYSSPTYAPASGVTAAEEPQNITITNQGDSMQRFSIQATKTWQDSENAYGTRPSDGKVSLRLQYLDTLDNTWKNVVKTTLSSGLYADGTGVYTTSDITQQITSAQTAAWANLPVNRVVAGSSVKISYRVVEETVHGYTTSYSSTSVTGSSGATQSISVTNTLDTTSLTLTKTWNHSSSLTDAGRPVEIGFQVQYSKDAGESWTNFGTVRTVAADSSGNWSSQLTNLPKTDAAEHTYSYRVSEVWISYDGLAKIQAIGSYQTQSVSTWSGSAGTYQTEVTTVQNEGGSWRAQATNTMQVTTYTAQKVWNDNVNRDGTRAAITLQLYRDDDGTYKSANAYGTPITLTQNADGSWQTEYVWSQLPMYQEDAAVQTDAYKSQYSVREITDLAAYTESVSGNTVTNSYTAESFSITATKVWDDDDDPYLLRPEAVTVKLQAATSTNGIVYTAYADVTSASYRSSAAGAYTSSSVSQQIAPDAQGEWGEAVWENLPVYANGYKIHYKVVETSVPSYSTAYSTEQITGGNGSHLSVVITNTLAEKVSVEVGKTWEPEGAAAMYQALPDSVQIQLQYRTDGEWLDVEANGTFDLTQEDSWNHTFTELPASYGTELQHEYRVIETSITFTDAAQSQIVIPVVSTEGDQEEGTVGNFEYTSQTTYNTLTRKYDCVLTNTLPETELTVQKIWDDNKDRDGIRPETVSVQLLRDGVEVGEPVTLEAESDWEYTWSYLPVYQNLLAESKSEYTVQELTVPEMYQVEYTYEEAESSWAEVTVGDVSAAEITNTYTAQSFSITTDKQWTDYEDPYGLRPVQVSVSLKASISTDGINYSAYADVTQGTFTNTSTGAYTTSDVSQLLSPNAQGVWNQALWEDLPVYANGYLIHYQVVEEPIPGYESQFTSEQITGVQDEQIDVHLTNTLKEETSVTVQKSWLPDTYAAIYDALPDRIQVALQYLDGTVWKDVSKNGTADLVAASGWTYTFAQLPSKDAQGDNYQYRVLEKSMTYGTSVVSAVPDAGDPENGSIGNFTYSAVTTYEEGVFDTLLTNELPEAKLTVQKQWADDADRDGLRTESVEVQLLRDGEPVGDPVTLSEAENEWSYTWNYLPVYQNGTAALEDTRSIYTVEEVEVPEEYQVTYSYGLEQQESTTVSTESAADVAVVNTHTPHTFTIEAEKVWEDAQNYCATRPDYVTFVLQYKNAQGEWVDVPDTESSGLISGLTPYTEQENPQTIAGPEFTGTTVWEVPCNLNDGTGPVAIEYRVYEQEIPSYTATASIELISSTEDGDSQFVTMTNSLFSTSLTVNKLWEDSQDAFATRPESITVQLQRRVAAGEWEDVTTGTMTTATLLKSNDWQSVVFTSLPQYADECSTELYEYRAVETELVYADETGTYTVYPTQDTAGSQSKVAGVYQITEDTQTAEDATFETTITNTLERTELSVTKTWEDQDNYYETRPQTDLTVKLQRRLAEGEGVIAQVTALLTGSEGWEDVQKDGSVYETALVYDLTSDSWTQAEFTQLPAKDASGAAYEYRAVEVTEVPGYTSETENTDASHSVITNTLTQMDISGTKTWEDFEDKYGARPTDITLTVSDQYGELSTQPQIVWDTTEDTWSYVIEGLPLYVPGSDEIADYTMNEQPVEQYTAQDAQVEVTEGRADFVNLLDMPSGAATLTKYGESTEGAKLSGAVYILSRSQDTGSGVEYFSGMEDQSAGFTQDRSQTAEVTTQADGTLSVTGLPYGDYYFTEVTAPTGYEVNSDPVEFEIYAKNQEKVQYVIQVDEASAVVPVSQQSTTTTSTTTSPKTGDPTALWMLWGLLAIVPAGAGVLYRRRKKDSVQ